MNIDIEKRVEMARQFHRQGFNCAQAVVAAYADIFDLDEQTALRISASFGGGIGMMRQTCGAACGMFMLCGLYCGQTNPDDKQAKMNNYKQVQNLAQQFKDINGSLICAELLGLKEPDDPNTIINKTTCNDKVADAATIIGKYLQQ